MVVALSVIAAVIAVSSTWTTITAVAVILASSAAVGMLAAAFSVVYRTLKETELERLMSLLPDTEAKGELVQQYLATAEKETLP